MEPCQCHRQYAACHHRTDYGICLEPSVEFTRIPQIVPPVSHDGPPLGMRLEPISKLPTAVDRITMSNDSAHGRAVGTHPGSFSGGEYCRWTSWAQTDSNALCARSGP